MQSYRLMADVSSNNGPISLENYSRAGHVAIAIKATEGTNYVNPDHFSECNRAHHQGLTVVHYHFSRPTVNNVEAEITSFRHTYLKGWRKGDYVAFDIEVEGTVDLRWYANRILTDFYSQTGHPPILYTYQAFYQEHFTKLRFPGNRLWIAKYSDGTPSEANWAWQYTDGKDGPEPHFYTGIGKCDGSVLNPAVAIRLRVRKARRRGITGTRTEG